MQRMKMGMGLIAAACAIALSAQSAVRTWDFGGRPSLVWNTDANWSGDVEPVAGDQAYFVPVSGWDGRVNIGNADKTIGAGASSFLVDGVAMNLIDTTAAGNLTIDAASNADNATLMVTGGGSLLVSPDNLILSFKNSAAAGSEFGKTRMMTSNGSIDFQGALAAQNSLTISAGGAADSIALKGNVAITAGKGIWLADSAGFITLASVVSGGLFLEIGTDATLASGSLISNSVGRLGVTGAGTRLVLGRNNPIACNLNTLDTSGQPQGSRTLDLDVFSNETTGTLALNDAQTLNIDFSDWTGNSLAFAASASMPWNADATLNLVGFDAYTDSLRFGTTSGGLSSQQVSRISVDGQFGSYSLNSNGFFNLSASTNPPPPLATNRPNVIIIFTDDHGYTDLGLHGIDSNLKTPTLDALAAGGALMVSGYSTAPQCVPSRSGILSGRIQNTFGTNGNGDDIPFPLAVPTIATRLSALGYKTGMIGKWHVSPRAEVTDEQLLPHTRYDYDPGRRGFGDFWDGAMNTYDINFDLNGNTVPEQEISDARNRVIVHGEAAQAFIARHPAEPFFLYLAIYGPHLPRISTTDNYYINFPAVDYPHYGAEMDDIRRMGLALVQAIDDAVAGVMAKLRELGLEENTLILFAGDNGAQPKFFDEVGGNNSLTSWNGSENVPLRGEKGSLWEGGIKVPMFAYWKNHIPANQWIPEYVTTLDFTATTLKLAGGSIPPEFEGTDILPRLTGETDRIARAKPMFWHWGREIAMRKGDWKVHRIGKRYQLFNLANDPNELYDLKNQLPAKYTAMQSEMMAWFNALPPEGQSPLVDLGDDLYVLGAPAGILADPRHIFPYGGSPAPYPSPMVLMADLSHDSDSDHMPDGDEAIAGTDPADSQSFFAIEPSATGELLVDGKAGRSYTVWTTPQLDPADWTVATNTGVLAASQAVQLHYLPAQTSGFYRVEVSQP